MTSISARLATFVPEDRPGRTGLDDRARELKDAYDAGFEAGAQAGAEAAAQDWAERQDQLSAQLVETIADQRTERAEAHTQVTAAFMPLVGLVLEKLAPELARAGLASTILATIESALARRPDLMPEVRCAPEVVDALMPASDRSNARFAIRADPTLTPIEARIIWDDGFDRIDAQDLLDTLLGETQRFVEAQTQSYPPQSKDTAHVG